MTRSVVLTGLGAVCAAGCGRHALAAVLSGSGAATTPMDRSAGYHRDGGSRLALQTAGMDLTTWLAPLKARRMSPSSRWAVASAAMALEDAGLDPSQVAGPGTAVIMASAYGAASVTEKLLRHIALDDPVTASPALFTESVANAPAAQVALAHDARGANITITQRQASPLLALAAAAREISTGRAERVLVGAVDELNPLIHAILDRFRALARPDASGREVARPFDLRRDGFLAADGATVLVAETEDAARSRGAAILARVAHAGAGFEPAAARAAWPRDPQKLAARLGRSLDCADLRVGDIDLVVSGACGGTWADRAEAGLLRLTWGDRALPPVLAPKGVTGEHGGGLLGAAVLATAGAAFGPTAGFAEPDPELGVEPHDGSPLRPPRRVLCTVTAAGGSAAWVVLEPGASG